MPQAFFADHGHVDGGGQGAEGGVGANVGFGLLPADVLLAGLQRENESAAAFQVHRHLIAMREAWVRPVSSALGAAVGAIGLAFLAVNMAT